MDLVAGNHITNSSFSEYMKARQFRKEKLCVKFVKSHLGFSAGIPWILFLIALDHILIVKAKVAC